MSRAGLPALPPPPATMLLTLQGAGAYDAAVHCASVSAARRLLQERLTTATRPSMSMPSMSDGSSTMRWLHLPMCLSCTLATHVGGCLSGAQQTLRHNLYGQAEVACPLHGSRAVFGRFAMMQGNFRRPSSEAIRRGAIGRGTVHSTQHRLCRQCATQEAPFRRCVPKSACSVRHAVIWEVDSRHRAYCRFDNDDRRGPKGEYSLANRDLAIYCPLHEG